MVGGGGSREEDRVIIQTASCSTRLPGDNLWLFVSKLKDYFTAHLSNSALCLQRTVTKSIVAQTILWWMLTETRQACVSSENKSTVKILRHTHIQVHTLSLTHTRTHTHTHRHTLLQSGVDSHAPLYCAIIKGSLNHKWLPIKRGNCGQNCNVCMIRLEAEGLAGWGKIYAAFTEELDRKA